MKEHPPGERGQRGFTLIELLIVIVILGILSAIVVFSVQGITDRGDNAACSANVETLAIASEAFRAQNGGYASSLGALSPGFVNRWPGGTAPTSNDLTVTVSGGQTYTINYSPTSGQVTATCPAAGTSGGGGGGGGGSPTTTAATCTATAFAVSPALDRDGGGTEEELVNQQSGDDYFFSFATTGPCAGPMSIFIDQSGSGSEDITITGFTFNSGTGRWTAGIRHDFSDEWRAGSWTTTIRNNGVSVGTATLNVPA